MKNPARTIFLIFLFFVFLESCSLNINQEQVNNYIDQETVSNLVALYNEFCMIDQALQNSSGTGSDVRYYYESAQEILEELDNLQVPGYLIKCKQLLINGIKMRSDGAGCFSNKTICGSDIEAIRLLSEGQNNLNNFLDEISEYQ